MSLVPPANFATVEEGVCRCAMPGENNVKFLKTLRLKTVLLLSNEPLEARVSQVLQSGGTKIVELGLEHWVPLPQWAGVGEMLMKAAVERILDASCHPVLLCCATGVHVTGAAVACLRKLQQWATFSVMEEYRAFAEPHHRTSIMHFIESFDPHIVTPDHSLLPAWHQEHLTQFRNDFAQARSVHTAPHTPYLNYYFATCGPTLTDKLSYEPKSHRTDA